MGNSIFRGDVKRVLPAKRAIASDRLQRPSCDTFTMIGGTKYEARQNLDRYLASKGKQPIKELTPDIHYCGTFRTYYSPQAYYNTVFYDEQPDGKGWTATVYL